MNKLMILTGEPLTRSILANFFDGISDFCVEGSFEDVPGLLSAVQNSQVDVLFADAEYAMQGNFLPLINPYGAKRPLIVLLARDGQAAAKSYEMQNVIDYVIKPSTPERLFLSLQKIRMQLSLINAYEAVGAPHSPRQGLCIYKGEQKMVKLSLDEILYVESVKDYIKIVTEKKSFLVYNTLTNFTASLPEGRFARIHRSYTVSVDKIDAIEGNTVEIMTTRLPFSRKYIAENQLKVFK